LVAAVNGIPKIALAPLFCCSSASAPGRRFNIAVTGVSFVVFYNVYLGLRLRERELVEIVQVMGGRRHTSSLRHDPHPRRPFFAALKTGGPLAILGVIGGEFIASSKASPRTLHLGHEPRRRDRVRRPDRPGGDDPDPERRAELAGQVRAETPGARSTEADRATRRLTAAKHGCADAGGSPGGDTRKLMSACKLLSAFAVLASEATAVVATGGRRHAAPAGSSTVYGCLSGNVCILRLTVPI